MTTAAPDLEASARRTVRDRLAVHPFVIASLLTLLSAGVYLIHYTYSEIGDTIPAEFLPINLLSGDGFDFTNMMPVGKPLHSGFEKIGDRVVSFYPIVPGLLNVPVYAIAKACGVDVMAQRFVLSGYTCVWISALSVGCMYLALSRICASVWNAIFFALLYAFATTTWSVTSRCLWQHGPSILFLSGAIALLLFKNKRWMAFSGLLLGLAVWNRPTNVVFAVPLAVYMLLNHRDRFVAFSLLALVPAMGMCVYSKIYWGSVMALGQGHRMGQWHGTQVTDFHGPLLEGLAGVLVSPSRGLLVFGPMFVFSFVYLGYACVSRRLDPIYRYLAIGTLGHLYLFSKWSVWWGGHSFAYRMLIEMVPALVIFAAAAWDHGFLRNRWLRVVFTIFALLSLYMHFLGAYYYPAGFNFTPNWIDLNTERLWWWQDTEIIRCHEHFMKDVRRTFELRAKTGGQM